MKEWSSEELLCNARGLDDGYLYVHKANPLSQKLGVVLQPGKTAKAPKTRLTDSASYGCAGFTGSVRPPLSNEIHPLDEETKIPCPSASAKVVYTSHDNLFADDIIDNVALCVAFSEPPKLSHKSIMLPGAVPPAPCLNSEDLRIRRPRLNRGGGTIANLGGASNGQSYKSGYGSMNISSYERDLAQRTGRGNQMYQAGTRAWGAMEPTPKRAYQPSNPFQGRVNGGVPPPPPPNRPPWQNQQQGGGYDYSGRQQQQQIPLPPPHRPQAHQQQYSQPGQRNLGPAQSQYNNQGNRPGHQGYQQQHQNYSLPQQYSNQGYPNQQHQQAPRPGMHQQGAQQQGFNFRSYNNQAPPPRQPPNPPSASANASVMSSLKAQLASTLNKNRRAQDKH
jgi:hypothetical protein